MAIEDILNRIDRIDQLIRLKATGTPQELANRLDISKRQVYRYIETIKNQGKDVGYEPVRRTYFYKS